MDQISFLIALGRINEIKWGITPQEWLDSHWYVTFNNVVLAEPSSSFFVFLLAFVILFVSLKFLKKSNHQKSRLWFGLSMLAWSLSTLSAGISYQVFSYELKCAGQEICLWTTPWEIVYLLLYVLSVKLLVVAVSYCCSSEKIRKFLQLYAFIAGVVYLVIMIIGIWSPYQFLISFENMVLFLIPSYLIMFRLNLWNYFKTKRLLDLKLMKAWFGMLFLTVVYFAFLMSGISGWLWENGIWFNANDVLHILLIIWAWYVLARIEPLVIDVD